MRPYRTTDAREVFAFRDPVIQVSPHVLHAHNARVINVGVEKTADRRAGFASAKGAPGISVLILRVGFYARARAATRCSTCAVCKRNCITDAWRYEKCFLVPRKNEGRCSSGSAGPAGSYGPHEFIRTMIIYCRGGGSEEGASL